MSNVRARGKIRHEEWPRIAERFRNGETLAEIARSYECTAPAIRYIIGRVSMHAEEARTATDEPERTAAPKPDDSRRRAPSVVSVEDRMSGEDRVSAPRPVGGSPTGEIWDRISGEIASFLAGMDALAENDSDRNYEELLVATDRLMWASARTRLELERVLAARKAGRKTENRRMAP